MGVEKNESPFLAGKGMGFFTKLRKDHSMKEQGK
jgi:hypothetical protein